MFKIFINDGKKISFYYYELNGKKKTVLKNGGKPYTVSPYDLIWDGDYYYVTGYCDEREAVRTFRVDRIKQQPIEYVTIRLLIEQAEPVFDRDCQAPYEARL